MRRRFYLVNEVGSTFYFDYTHNCVIEELDGLGFEFAIEVQKAIERIIQYPNSWSKLSTRTRKCRCNRFPYNVIYSLKDETIIIIAIMHTKRKPNYWEKRNIN